jgi:hypothetical protein
MLSFDGFGAADAAREERALYGGGRLEDGLWDDGVVGVARGVALGFSTSPVPRLSAIAFSTPLPDRHTTYSTYPTPSASESCCHNRQQLRKTSISFSMDVQAVIESLRRQLESVRRVASELLSQIESNADIPFEQGDVPYWEDLLPDWPDYYRPDRRLSKRARVLLKRVLEKPARSYFPLTEEEKKLDEELFAADCAEWLGILEGIFDNMRNAEIDRIDRCYNLRQEIIDGQAQFAFEHDDYMRARRNGLLDDEDRDFWIRYKINVIQILLCNSTRLEKEFEPLAKLTHCRSILQSEIEKEYELKTRGGNPLSKTQHNRKRLFVRRCEYRAGIPVDLNEDRIALFSLEEHRFGDRTIGLEQGYTIGLRSTFPEWSGWDDLSEEQQRTRVSWVCVAGRFIS